MELRWLEDFIVLAETRHFSRAANRQNVTQPTFSRRIKLLEESMGAVLVDRRAAPLTLTPAGEEFLILCQQMTERVQVTRERLQTLAQSQAETIRLAAPQSLVTHYVPAWLADQGLSLRVEPYLRATSWLIEDYFQALRRGEIELALCYWPKCWTPPKLDLERLDSVCLGEERLVPVSAVDSHGKAKFALPGTEGRPLPYIAYHPSGLIAATIREHLEHIPERVHLAALSENVQTSNIRELIVQGYGLGWLPQRTVDRLLERGKLTRAGGSRWDVALTLRLYFHRDNHHPGLAAVLAHLQEPSHDTIF
ncbi:LysR family transcriptional regulator [Salinicola aestuarinus]|uniref:LysR family transcriptional regulator n=1 Tax=Salinicola aestuarinus TaxID=1949082 RepID=UPI000DA24478|nr:LysR family transcriptional regulator [Salinicola aestuarinus]